MKNSTSSGGHGASDPMLCSAFKLFGIVMSEADQLEELIQLKLENPGMIRKDALEWALEMRRLYVTDH